MQIDDVCVQAQWLSHCDQHQTSSSLTCGRIDDVCVQAQWVSYCNCFLGICAPAIYIYIYIYLYYNSPSGFGRLGRLGRFGALGATSYENTDNAVNPLRRHRICCTCDEIRCTGTAYASTSCCTGIAYADFRFYFVPIRYTGIAYPHFRFRSAAQASHMLTFASILLYIRGRGFAYKRLTLHSALLGAQKGRSKRLFEEAVRRCCLW